MGGFGSKESIAVGGEVVFVELSVNGEVSFLVESFESAAGLFHGAELWGVPGGGGGEGHRCSFPGGQGVKGVREDGVQCVSVVV